MSIPSSNLDLVLDPHEAAGSALRRVHLALLAVLRANEDGVRQDLDPEFLHQFRVAVRRLRALLGQLDGVFPPAATANFRKRLSWLGRATGPTRDWDVFLEVLPRWHVGSVETFDPLIQFLCERRARAQAKLIKALDSERYRRLLADWQNFLETTPEVEEGNAVLPIAELVLARIKKLHRRLVKQGRRLEVDSPDADFHALRIEAKKLRYLLDVFRPILRERAAQRLIEALKGLQEGLGELQDLTLLGQNLEIFTETNPPTPSILLCGRMLERFAGRRLELKAECADSIDELRAKKKLLDHLLVD